MLKPLKNSSTEQSSRIFCHELFSVLRNPLFKPKSRITNSCKSSWFRYDSSMSRTITTEHCPQLRPHKGYASFYVHRSQPQSDHLVGVSAVRHQSSPQLETNRQVLVFSRVPLPFKAESWSKPSGLSRCVCVFDCAVRGQVRQPNGSPPNWKNRSFTLYFSRSANSCWIWVNFAISCIILLCSWTSSSYYSTLFVEIFHEVFHCFISTVFMNIFHFFFFFLELLRSECLKAAHSPHGYPDSCYVVIVLLI